MESLTNSLFVIPAGACAGLDPVPGSREIKQIDSGIRRNDEFIRTSFQLMTWYLATAMLVVMKGLSISLTLLILLSGCASKLPPAISTAPPGDLTISAVRAGAGNHSGRMVRWGGEIIRVENRKQFTDISVLARPLNEEGKPHSSGSADGRFIARFRGFLEPEEYKPGRLITVSGRFTTIERHKVGEFRYAYPVVEVVEHYRWPRPVTVPAYRNNPFLYDPWWPYHPYRYHPYYPYWW